MRFQKSIFLLISWIFILLLMGYLLGLLTQASIPNWYVFLNKSPFTPPNFLFGIAWTILYICIAVSGWLIWHKQLTNLKHLFVLQLILNWVWTPLFFTYHFTGLSFLCIAFICALVGLLLYKAYFFKPVFWLLLPYFLWLLFASHLNFYVWQYN